MKKCVLFLLVSLFFVSFISAVPDCKYSITPYSGAAPLGVYWFLNWENQLNICNFASTCVLLDISSGKTYNYTLGQPIPFDYTYKYGDVRFTNKVCREEISLSSSFCGDGVIQIPNSNGINEECDNSSDTNCVACKRVTPLNLQVPVFTRGFCSDDQTLFRMYRENNSHVSAYTDSNYPLRICYKDLFGINYVGANPHACNEKNILFWISSSKNSHVSKTQTEIFNTSVCYGNLNCRFSSSDCPATEVLLGRTFLEENSHLSLNQPEYPYRICCSNSLSARDYYWADLTGKQVERIELSDTVLMVTKGFGFGNREITYTIIGESAGLNLGTKVWNYITLNGWSAIEPWVETRVNSWQAIVPGVFYFNATNLTGVGSSENLNVTEPEVNSIPSIIVYSNKSIISQQGQGIFFNTSIFDTDDLLEVIWDFGDGVVLNFSDYAIAFDNGSVGRQTHTYSSPGYYQVILTVKEKTRSNLKKEIFEVFSYGEGINVVPVISSPIPNKNYENLVLFDASQSHVLNCSNTAFREGYDFMLNGTSLRCVYIHSPGQTTTGTGYSLFVEWTIDGVKSVSGNWGSVKSSGYIQNFLNYFSNPGKHLATLKLTFSN
jgi:hypothetical protein